VFAAETPKPPDEPTPDAQVIDAPSEQPVSAPAVPAPPAPPSPARFSGRFVIIYIALGAVLAGAITGLVILARQPNPPKPPPWSSWRPPSGSTTKMSREIIDHISSQYALDSKGDQLVAVFPSAPEVTQNTKVTDVSTIAIRQSAQSNNFSRIVKTTGTLQQQFCGLGTGCSITRGTPSAARERLVRREALEIALYTFKYVPAIHAVVAFMPPPPGTPPSTLLFLEREGLAEQLSKPLRATLPHASPPLPSNPDSAEAAKIDNLTLPVEYGFQYETLNDGTAALILTPQS
jgi:hypothetical protein